MDDHPLLVVAFALVFGALIVVKAWQNFLGNIEAELDREPLRVLVLTAIVCLVLGMVAGGLLLDCPEPSSLKLAASICRVE